MSVGFTLRVSMDIVRKSRFYASTYVLAPHKSAIEYATATESLNRRSNDACYPTITVMLSRIRSINYVFRQPSTIVIVKSSLTSSKKPNKKGRFCLTVIVTV